MRKLSDTEMGARVAHHFCSGLLYAKQVSMAKGEAWGTHAHPHDHMSVLATGRVRVMVDGVTTEHTAPAYILIGKGKHHGVIAMEDSEWFCIHATEETEPGKVDAVILGDKHAV